MRDKIHLKYGRESIALDLSAGSEWVELRPDDVMAMPNERLGLYASLEAPVGCAPLREALCGVRRVAVVVSDATRPVPTRRFLPYILDYLNAAGLLDHAIDVLIAYGSHRMMSDAETAALLGENIARRVRVHHHDCRDEARLVDLGTTSQGLPVRLNRLLAEADLVIATGGVAHHYFAGFGGGRKALVPGCAAHETILANHRLVLQDNGELLCPRCRSGVLDGNPVHEAALEAARMAGKIFAVNVVLNSSGEIAHFISGALDASHRRACEIVDALYTKKIDAPVKLVLASCGGWPADTDLIQMHKAIDHAAEAVGDGGVLIICGAAENGVGSSTFERWFDYSDLPTMAAAIRRDYTLNAQTAYAMRQKAARIKICLQSGLEPEFVRRMGLMPVESIKDALADTLSDAKRAYIIPDASRTLVRIAK